LFEEQKEGCIFAEERQRCNEAQAVAQRRLEYLLFPPIEMMPSLAANPVLREIQLRMKAAVATNTANRYNLGDKGLRAQPGPIPSPHMIKSEASTFFFVYITLTTIPLYLYHKISFLKSWCVT
jgi:hypothetical protein